MKLLEMNEWKIVKQINIVSKNSFGVDITIGYIIYEREISPDYKYIDDESEDGITKLLNYPKQNCFPSDDIDLSIVNAIKEKFPNSFVSNYQIVFDTDKERFSHLLSRPNEQAFLEIRPNFSNIDLNALRGITIEIFRKKINVYQDFTLDSIKNLYFIGECEYDNSRTIFEKLDKINFK